LGQCIFKEKGKASEEGGNFMTIGGRIKIKEGDIMRIDRIRPKHFAIPKTGKNFVRKTDHAKRINKTV